MRVLPLLLTYLVYNFNHSSRNSHNRCWDYNFPLLQYKHTLNHSKTSSIFWPKENPKETETILTGSMQQLIAFPKIKGNPEKVREPLQMLWMDFSDYVKYKAYTNSKDRSKLATTFV